MFVLDYSDRRPIYEQITEKLQDLILQGVLEKDAPLPSVRSLALDLSINPNTIQRAYQNLERDGWIYSVRGKGSFVAASDAAMEGRRENVRQKLSLLIGEAKLVGLTKELFLLKAEQEWDAQEKMSAQGLKASPTEPDSRSPEYGEVNI